MYAAGGAAQFHNALLENGVKSVLVTYPEEGHGIRSYRQPLIMQRESWLGLRNTSAQDKGRTTFRAKGGSNIGADPVLPATHPKVQCDR